MPPMTLADVRAKYPYYKDVDDQKLADALYQKYYPHADRREFDARIGLKPYQNALEAMGTAVAGVPGRLQKSAAGLEQMALEGGLEGDEALLNALGSPEAFQGRFTPLNSDVVGSPAAGIRFVKWAKAQGIEDVNAYAQTPEAKKAYERYLRSPDSAAYQRAEAELAGELKRQQIDATLPVVDAKPGSAEDIAASALGSVAEMTPALVASAVTRNPLPAMTFAGASVTGTAYGEGRDQTLDPEQARQYALLYGAAEGISELLPLSIILKEGGSFITKATKGAVAEGLQEGLTEGIQALVDKGYLNPDMTWAEAWPRIQQAALTGVVAGPAMAAIASGTQAATRGVQDFYQGIIAPKQVGGAVIDPTPAPENNPFVEEAPAIEEIMALPAPETLLALPSPAMFGRDEQILDFGSQSVTLQPEAATVNIGPAYMTDAAVLGGPGFSITRGMTPDGPKEYLAQDGRFYPMAMAKADGQTAPVTYPDSEAAKKALGDKVWEKPTQLRAMQEAELDRAARLALQQTRQAETAELLRTARETITPLGVFTNEELGPRVTGRIKQWRVQTGRNPDAPVTMEDLGRARIAPKEVDAIIAAKRPHTSEGAFLEPLEVTRAAEGKNLVTDDKNFAELALRSTGQRDVNRMSQVQLRAFKSVIDSLPVNASRSTVPLATPPVFSDEQYNKAVDAVRRQGRYTLAAIKQATGIRNTREAEQVRDTMVRRGQLVQRGENDYRLYDVTGKERQTVPADLPPGAFKEHVIRRIPVNQVRIRQNGKSIGTFGSGTEAREKVRAIRQAETEKGEKQSAIAIEPAGDVAWGVMENRYDERGNLLGQVVVDTYRDSDMAQKAARELNVPREDARPVPEAVPPAQQSTPKPGPSRRTAPPAALAGREAEVLANLDRQIGQRALPLLGTRVRVRGQLTTPTGEPVEGVFMNNVINISAANLDPSMSVDEMTEVLGQIMDHELVHALRKAGVLGPETAGWKSLSRYVRRTQRPDSRETYFEWTKRRYAGRPGYDSVDALEEEAIAEAFRHWAANKRAVTGQPASVFRQLVQWFRNLINAVPADIFSKIETGQLVREALTPPGSTEPRAEAAEGMKRARKNIAKAQALPAETASQRSQKDTQIRRASRGFLRAKAQAREDRYGKAGPKTVLGTSPSSAYATGELMDRTWVGDVVSRYREASGRTEGGRLGTYLPIDLPYLERVAEAQQRSRHDPENLAVAKAYRALINETRAMYDALGPLEVTAWTEDGPPYRSAAEIGADLAAGRLKLRLSEAMFGPGADNPGHPLNDPSGLRTTDGQPLTHNDLLRVVHEVYGYGQSGFRPDMRGAYNAYHEHARLLSDEAARALATETLAQDAWHNAAVIFRRPDGSLPRLGDADYLPESEREFAEQKAFLLPEDLLRADPGRKIAAEVPPIYSTNETPRYMVGWHGTPHKVDRFSNEKIGTGEGAQAFGWGLYFAGKREVAEYYQKTLGKTDTYYLLDGRKVPYSVLHGNDVDTAAAQLMIRRGNDKTAALEELDGLIAVAQKQLARNNTDTARERLQQWTNVRDVVAKLTAPVERRTDTSGNLYKVDIPEDSELLLWDAPLSEQPRGVREKLESFGLNLDQLAQDMFDGAATDLTGAQIYEAVAAKVAPTQDGSGTDRAASEALKAAGIPGHKYLDGGSRNPAGSPARNDGTYNYVIYDDSRVTILEENPKFSVFDEQLPGGRFYGKPRSAGALLADQKVPTPDFSRARDGNTYFGGQFVEEQLRRAREGIDGTALIYLPPGAYIELTGNGAIEQQDVLDVAIGEGYKFSAMPSLVLNGYAGNVRVEQHDGRQQAAVLAARGTAQMPVMIYPKSKEPMGLVTALEGPRDRVLWPRFGDAEGDVWIDGPKWSVGSEKFKRWFGSSKVVDDAGQPLVVYHGSTESFNEFKKTVLFDDVVTNGFFFTADPQYGYVRREEGMVYPVYLKIENPYFVKRSEEMEGLNVWGNAGEWIDQLKAAGHDGIIWGDQSNLRRPPYGAWGNDRSQLFVFEPTQIKSAIGNNGEYDAANPDIRYSLFAPFGRRVPPLNTADMHNVVRQRTEGAIGRFLSMLGRSKTSFPLIGSVFDFRVKFQDKMLSVKEMIEDVGDRGGNINDYNNAYLQEQLYHGRVFEQIRQREQGLYVPLLDALAVASKGTKGVPPVSVKDFEDYLYARHAPERNAFLRARGSTLDSPSGMTDAEATAMIDTLSREGKMPVLERLAAMADAVVKNTNQTRLDAGLISEEIARSTHFENYVPLRGVAEEQLDPEEGTALTPRPRSGKGFAIGGKEDRSMTGRKRKAGDILGHLFLQNTEAVIRSEKNEVAMSMMRFLSENPNSGYGRILPGPPKRKIVGANGMIQDAVDPMYRQRPDVLVAKYKGGEIVAELADERVARALKSDYVTSSGMIIGALGKWNRYLATINTSLNPEFLISNFARDAQVAAAIGQQYDIKGFSRKIIKDAPKAAAGVREVLRKGTTNSRFAKLFRELQEAGGTTEFMGIHDLDSQVRKIRGAIGATGLRMTAQKALDQVKRVGQFVDDYNKVVENTLRLSAYAAAREAGVSKQQAAYIAKNLTVNFNKGGELKGQMNALYLFYNASMQGTMTLLNGLKSKRVQRVVGGVVLLGVMQDILNRLISGDDDENGVPDYDDIPDYILENNLVFMDPWGILGDKGYFALPLPYGLNVFHNAGRNFAGALSGSPVRSPAKAFTSTLLTALDTFNPVGGVNSIWNFLAPTVADPLVDLITNKDYAGRDIVPDRPSFGQPVPESQKFWSNTDPLLVGTAAAINELTGGNELRKGAVDFSPEVYEYVIDYLTGAAGAFVARVANGVTETGPQLLAGDFENIDLGEIPFLRRVVGTITNRGNTERYYQNAGEVLLVGEELELFKETGNREAYERRLASAPVEVALLGYFEKVEKQLQDMRKQLREVRAAEGLDPTRRAEIEDTLKKRMDLLMAEANRLYYERKNPKPN